MKKRRALLWAGALLTPAIGIFLLFMIGEMREMSALRFEAGEQVGAEV